MSIIYGERFSKLSDTATGQRQFRRSWNRDPRYDIVHMLVSLCMTSFDLDPIDINELNELNL